MKKKESDENLACWIKKYNCVHRFADGTTHKATAKEKPVLKYGGFNPRGPLEQFHRVISFVAICDELTRVCFLPFLLAALRSCAISAAN